MDLDSIVVFLHRQVDTTSIRLQPHHRIGIRPASTGFAAPAQVTGGRSRADMCSIRRSTQRLPLPSSSTYDPMLSWRRCRKPQRGSGCPTLTLTCPKCAASMRSLERNGVTIEQCVQCGGVFLDRGELDHLIDAETTHYRSRSASSRPDYVGRSPRQWRVGQQPKRGGFLSELFGMIVSAQRYARPP